MSKSLYCLNDPGIGGVTFGSKPYDDKHWVTYGLLTRRISLKNDLGWSEVRELQNAIRKSDLWNDFPAKGYTLVSAEFKGCDEVQRIDLLYIRSDGALLPCELKIGGDSLDAHGQLIRYISDLSFQKVDLSWVKNLNQTFLTTITDSLSKKLHEDKLNNFIQSNGIINRFVRCLPRSGIFMDESFKPQVLKTVRYLNDYCGFAIRLLQIETFVDATWTPQTPYFFRIDFVDVQ